MRVYSPYLGCEFPLGPVLGDGGEALVHEVPGHDELVVKVYHQPAPESEQKLDCMLARTPRTCSIGGGYADLVWPLGKAVSAENGKTFLGFLMPRVRNRIPLEVLDIQKPKPFPLDYQFRLRIARNVAWALTDLHDQDIRLPDLGGNVLVHRNATVTLIDCDSCQIRDGSKVFRCLVRRLEYTAPERQTVSFKDVDALPTHDIFGLGVLIFKLMMFGTHAFAAKNIGILPRAQLYERIAQGAWPYATNPTHDYRPRDESPPFSLLHPRLQELMRETFETGHRRPSAAAWKDALIEIEKDRTFAHKVAEYYEHGWPMPVPAAKTPLVQPPVNRKSSFRPVALATAAVFLVIILAGIWGRQSSSGSQFPHKAPPTKQRTVPSGNQNLPTPKLWQILAAPDSRGRDGRDPSFSK